MMKSLSAAVIAMSLIAGPALAQGTAPVTTSAKIDATANVKTPSVHKRVVHKSHRHVVRVKHVKISKHAVHRVKHVKHVKHLKPAKQVKRIKHSPVLNTAG
jgi:hypothetical protein